MPQQREAQQFAGVHLKEQSKSSTRLICGPRFMWSDVVYFSSVHPDSLRRLFKLIFILLHADSKAINKQYLDSQINHFIP